MGSSDQCSSVLEFFKQHDGKQIASDVYFEWKDLLLDIGFEETFRKQHDQWFQSCHRIDLKLSNDMVSQEQMRLFDMLKSEVNQKVQNGQNRESYMELQYVEKKFGGGEKVVDAAIQCLRREEQMLGPYIQPALGDASIRLQEQIMKPLRDSYEQCLADYEKLQKVMLSAIAVNDEKTNISAQVTEIKNHICSLEKLGPQLHTDPKVKELHNKVISERDRLGTICKELRAQLTLKMTEALQLFVSLLELLTNNNSLLLNAVATWRQQFKLFYAKLDSEPKLDNIADWCAKTGKLLFDIDQEGWAQLTKFVVEDGCLDLKKKLERLLIELLQGTFIVVEQDNYVIKKESKNLKIIVRVLAADQISHILTDGVKASLVHDDDLNKCCEEFVNSVSSYLDQVKQKSMRFVGKTGDAKFLKNKKKKHVEGEFKGLQVVKFERPGSQKQVHEERYKIVFETSVRQNILWTLSLPLVMITGSNQQCHSLASIMWACFSTDIWSLPSVVPNELPLETVVSMLEAKMRQLCPSYGLTDDNKEHLKKRLIGSGDFTDDTPVSLQKFCFDKMLPPPDNGNKPLTFSFWQWFVACYNLIAKYLLPYWEKGWIVGFMSKTTAKEKLISETSRRDGLFILRFSDSIIVHSQGITSMFGQLTACFTCEKTSPGGETKRSVCTGANVADYKELEKTCLANMLSATMTTRSTHCYRYVYPCLKSREDTFDKYIEFGAVVANYCGVKQQWLIDIEQMLSDEILLGKRTESGDTKSTKQRLSRKKTRGCGTRSADTSALCNWSKCSTISESPMIIEDTTSAADAATGSVSNIPIFSEISDFIAIPYSSLIESPSDVLLDDSVVPNAMEPNEKEYANTTVVKDGFLASPSGGPCDVFVDNDATTNKVLTGISEFAINDYHDYLNTSGDIDEFDGINLLNLDVQEFSSF